MSVGKSSRCRSFWIARTARERSALEAAVVIRTPREVVLLIREQRKAAGITQSELAERVGSSREWVRLAEAGKPRLDLGLALRALAALGITLNAATPESRVKAARPRVPLPKAKRKH